MSKFFEGMKIGVDQYGIKDFDNITLDGTNYQKHGDSNRKGAPVIEGFHFTIETLGNTYHGEIVLKPSPYVKYTERPITYQAKLDIDFPITNKTIQDAGLEWLDSQSLPVTSEERSKAREWLKTQTKFSVLDWYHHFKGEPKGADIICAKMAEYLMSLPPSSVSLYGTTRDGQVMNFEADLIITKNDEKPQTFPIHETVLENGVYQLFISDIE